MYEWINSVLFVHVLNRLQEKTQIEATGLSPPEELLIILRTLTVEISN